jgi:hypothetical protein
MIGAMPRTSPGDTSRLVSAVGRFARCVTAPAVWPVPGQELPLDGKDYSLGDPTIGGSRGQGSSDSSSS